MSLLYLVHKNVVIKFADVAKNQFNPETRYAFRLTGVDAMGFLQIQDLRQNSHAGHEAASEPYWINKDLIREIHELDLAKVREALHYTGQSTKPAKAKSPIKPKPALKEKPLPGE